MKDYSEGLFSEHTESVVNLLQWVYVDPDHFADGQHALRVPFQTVVPVGVHGVTDSGERLGTAV